MATDHDIERLFREVRQQRDSGQGDTLATRAMVDELALAQAHLARREIANALNLRLTLDEWSQLTAILQVRIALTVRHTAFDPPPFPGRKSGGFEYYDPSKGLPPTREQE